MKPTVLEDTCRIHSVQFRLHLVFIFVKHNSFDVQKNYDNMMPLLITQIKLLWLYIGRIN